MPTYTLQVSDELTSAIRVVPLAELVSTYLRAIVPSAYCDPCLAGAMQELVEVVRQTAEDLACPEQFARKLGRCTKRIVTRVDPSRF